MRVCAMLFSYSFGFIDHLGSESVGHLVTNASYYYHYYY